MDTPMLAERGWCMAGSSKGKSTDTSGCKEENNGQQSSSEEPPGKPRPYSYQRLHTQLRFVIINSYYTDGNTLVRRKGSNCECNLCSVKLNSADRDSEPKTLILKYGIRCSSFLVINTQRRRTMGLYTLWLNIHYSI